MAVTSLWRVKTNLGAVVEYADDDDKTTTTVPINAGWVDTVLDYAMRDDATYNDKPDDVVSYEDVPLRKKYVSGVNCEPDTAAEDMRCVKARWGKTGGTLAYHGYQSFAPGETSADEAHEIGVKLARELWGDNYQVVVATHFDKESHIHNHFVVNTVGFKDGKKFYRSNQDYRDMRTASDALCRKYGLSVIGKTQGITKHYTEWQADRSNMPTYRHSTQKDIDQCIKVSNDDAHFWRNMRMLGYEFKFGKDVSSRAFGRERFIRWERNFGADYSVTRISERIRERLLDERSSPQRYAQVKVYRYAGVFRLRKKPPNTLLSLYLFYLARLRGARKQLSTSPGRAYHLVRADVAYAKRVFSEGMLLSNNGIKDTAELEAYKSNTQERVHELVSIRADLRLILRSASEGDGAEALKRSISDISKELATLRKELDMCSEIAVRSQKIVQVRKAEIDAWTTTFARRGADSRLDDNKQR